MRLLAVKGGAKMASVLVVEDYAALNRSVCSFLHTAGHEPVAAHGAMEAFDMQGAAISVEARRGRGRRFL